ncbi:hypothetical protein CHS0354_038340 [Potamilus streckersoni]|uniref:Uncharacterized protein n=1 Tax=Potamilus streckersoni TaxID=2493646 RepID=A0AAE0S6J0_9BIVA|nr:hypothetical protein CHS0354_038340 [Potamilus streckersoni]
MDRTVSTSLSTFLTDRSLYTETPSLSQSETRRPCCPLCLSSLRMPKALPCLHTFCENCLATHMDRSIAQGKIQGYFKCPICGLATSAPVGEETSKQWAGKFPINYLVLAVQEKQMACCQPCLNDKRDTYSAAYCETCSENLCLSCIQHHKRLKIAKDHVVIELNNMESPAIDPSKISLLHRCPLHGKSFECFCDSHQELCCSKCIIVQHKNCKKVDAVEDIAAGIKEGQLCKQMKSKFGGLQSNFQKVQNHWDENLKEIEQKMTDIKDSIFTWKSNIIEKVEELTSSALSELDQIYGVISNEITSRLEECRSVIAAIEISVMMLEVAIQKAEDPGCFMILNKLSNQVDSYATALNNVYETAIKMKLDFTPDSEVQNFQRVRSLGKLSKLEAPVAFRINLKGERRTGGKLKKTAAVKNIRKHGKT